MARRRLQAWLDRRDRNNQIVMDAMCPPSRPREPAVVLQALTPIPDPAFAYPLQVRIDGKTVDEVPWGWSVHPLELGDHRIDLWHQAGFFISRGSRAIADFKLDPDEPVAHLIYRSTTMGFRRGRITVEPYAPRGGANSHEHGGANPS